MRVIDNEKFLLGVMPSHQVGFDLFAGQWTGRLPLESCVTGSLPLFDDARPRMMVERIGPIEGFRVLELGPMEGHQTFQLERLGAQVLGIEGNSSLWLKCLVAKNALGLRATYLLGDFVTFIEGTQERFDLVFASGVLYHMLDPVGFLRKVAERAPRLFLWTHYYEASAIKSSAISESFVHEPELVNVTNHGQVRLYHRQYPEAEVGKESYCGGIAPACKWMECDDIMGCLKAFGFQKIQAFGFGVGAQGPSVCVTAVK